MMCAVEEMSACFYLHTVNCNYPVIQSFKIYSVTLHLFTRFSIASYQIDDLMLVESERSPLMNR